MAKHLTGFVGPTSWSRASGPSPDSRRDLTGLVARRPFPCACRGKGGQKKRCVKFGSPSGEGPEARSLKENPVKRPYREKDLTGKTCGSNEPGKVLSYTPLCRWLLWFCLALFCLAFLGECFCPNRFLFGPQAAKGREQSSPAAAGSLCLNEQSSPAPPARSA